MLSAEQRRALEERAVGLRAERSALSAERDQSLQVASDSQRDAKLVQEVARLEREVEVVRAEKDSADGTVDDAMRVMNAAIQSSGVKVPDSSSSDAPVSVSANAAVDAAVADVNGTEAPARIRPKGGSQ